ncbi:hypothetical protein MtrunA17_Chr8g0345251 [Medicago truncatula]|uniref:DUF674 family protein n=1 Tax=Medicago truncatula TaxID=3880 RepID=A0A396GEF3_MEDTR|nr:uncharacterized protein LOC11446156 [Medicago truncatula]RHN39570.1 hypothetical protein MtrunA17_Chr8g0345251 [Medicago truncatula]
MITASLFPSMLTQTHPLEYFICSKYKHKCPSHHVSTSNDTKCVCRGLLDHPIKLQHSHNGFLTDSDLIYVIDDSLRLEPLTVDSSGFNLIKGNLESRDSFKEWLVHVDRKRMVDLIKCCVSSTTPLTDFCFQRKPLIEQADVINYTKLASEDIFDDTNFERMSLEVFMTKEEQKIIYAYTDEKFVEFLISFLAYPLGSVIEKLNCKTGLANIDSLYRSAKQLKAMYLPDSINNLLLQPLVAHSLASKVCMFGCEKDPPIFMFYKSLQAESDGSIEWCLTRQETGNPESVLDSIPNISLIQKNAAKSGCVLKTPPNKYLIHSNLNFGEMSENISVPDYREYFPSLTAETISIGMRECLQILRASLTSGSALDDGLHAFL